MFMKTKFVIKILNTKDNYMERRDDEKYYYEIHQENKQRYVSLFNIKRAKKFQSTKNAKMH